jgi:hypothetical protein
MILLRKVKGTGSWGNASDDARFRRDALEVDESATQPQINL